jgi:transposase
MVIGAPEDIWVERHIRHRYGCPTCRRGEAIKIAPVPAQLLPKTNAGSSLLAPFGGQQIRRWDSDLPHVRGQLERLGLDLSPSAAGTWVNAAGDKMTRPGPAHARGVVERVVHSHGRVVPAGPQKR